MRKSHWLLLCAVIVFAGLLLLALRSGSSRHPRSVKLADGRVLTIEKLTFGTNHNFIYGNPFTKIAAPILRPAWKAKLGLRTVSMQTPSASLVIWGEWEFPPNGGAPASDATLTEGNGEAAVRVIGISAAFIPNRQAIMRWQIDNFPRRAPAFHFTLSEATNGVYRPIAAFDLPNPARRQYPVWRPARLPISQSRRGLEFEALNFSRGTFPNVPWWAAFGQPLVRTGYLAVLRVKQEGRALTNWQVERARILDATGNPSAPRFFPSFVVGDYLLLAVPAARTWIAPWEEAPLWPSENAWKLIPQFTRAGGFASNELCVLKGIPVPGSTVGTQMLVHAEANGVTLIALHLKPIATAWDFRFQPNLDIGVIIQPREDRQISLFEVIDDRGRHLRHARSKHSGDDLHFDVELLSDSKSLDLTFAVQEPVTVEFLVGLSPPAKKQ